MVIDKIKKHKRGHKKQKTQKENPSKWGVLFIYLS
jgi:hypothetical protein